MAQVNRNLAAKNAKAVTQRVEYARNMDRRERGASKDADRAALKAALAAYDMRDVRVFCGVCNGEIGRRARLAAHI